MEEEFYRRRIEQGSGAAVLVPPSPQRAYIDEAIFSRMCRDEYTADDRAAFIEIATALLHQGAEAIILGCTELPILLRDAPFITLESTRLHCLAAVDWSLDAAAA